MNKIFSLFILFLFSNQLLFSEMIMGKVISTENNSPIKDAKIKVYETSQATTSNKDGLFSIDVKKLPELTLSISSEKFESKELKIEIKDYLNKEIVIELSPKTYIFDDLVIFSASKNEQRITQSAAAIYAQSPEEIRSSARKGQIAQVFQNYTGIDVLQNGSSDFIVNTRGFNSGLNRRILVLQDGRDASMPLLGAQEWNSFSLPLDEFSRVEFVRGPSASLYGANAFNGVMNLISYSPKEVLGAKASLLAGDYKTLKADARFAGLWGDLSYKLTLGHSQRLNWANRRDSVQFLEYAGLPLEKKTITEDDRNTQSNYGTIRFDYDLTAEKKLTAELGYSRNTNELFVFGLGRTFVKDVERPYARIAFTMPSFHFQAHYMQRHVLDTMWLMVPGAPLLDNSKDIFFEGQYNYKFNDELSIMAGASQDFQIIRTYGTSIPNDVNANYTGVYGQVEYKTNYNIDFLTSARVDFASIHSTQFSPRFSIVYNPIVNHKFRLSAGNSFQRPNYSELYRLTPDAPAFDPKTGKPVNFAAIEKRVNDSLAALTGTNPNLSFGLNAFNAKAVGNENLKVEKNTGLELGYEGIIFERLKISADVYYNKLTDFITNFLPGVNPQIPSWQPQLPNNLKEYDTLVRNIIYNSLKPIDQARLSDFQGKPTFVVSNTNVGEVDQWGFELNLNYFITQKLLVDVGYTNYNFSILKSNDSQKLLPNTSPNRYKIGLSFVERNLLDIKLDFAYTQGFDWLAGTMVGYVPDYAVLNLNAGFYPIKNLEVGINIYNLLDRKHYEMFGGTYIPRYTTIKLSYQI
jgi:iron complex outermembrane receptor protein